MPYPPDPGFRGAVTALLGAVFPSIPPALGRAAALGGDWFAVSTPHVEHRDGQVVAHAGVVEASLWLEGRPRKVAAVHAVCVHPAWRGQGLGRRVVERALAFADELGRETSILWSEKVDFYRRFGFVAHREPCFVGAAPRPEGARAVPLDLDDETDRRFLRAQAAARTPVSDLAAGYDDGWLLALDLALWREAREHLYRVDDAVVVAANAPEELHILDVIAGTLPPLARIAGAFGRAAGDPVRLAFGPDKLAPGFAPQPFGPPQDDEDRLFVRGAPLVSTPAPWRLSVLTRT